MIEFTDIRIRAALPLHPYLVQHPRLSLKLIVDKDICGETPGVNGNLVTGAWIFNSSLSAADVKQSLTIAVTTGPKNDRIQVVSVTVKAAELLARVKDRTNSYQELDIFDSSAPLQLKLFMTCSIKSSSIPDRPLQAVGDRDHTNEKRGKNTQSYIEPEKADLSSRRDLESLYAMAVRMPDRDYNKAHILSTLGRAYRKLYQEEWKRVDLEKAVSMHEEAMQFSGPFQQADHAHYFSMALVERFKQSRDLVDIQRAISHCQTALKFTEGSDVDEPDRLSVLGVALQLRFERTGDRADVENSISCLRKAIELTPNGRSETPSWYNNLGLSILRLFERFGSLKDLEDAICNMKEAVKLTPDGDPDKLTWFNNLGGALLYRFEHLGSPVDIEDAICNKQKTIELMPKGHPNEPSLLNDLGSALQLRFERLGGLETINDAVRNHQKAVDLTLDDHPDKPNRLSNLGTALHRRFERFGNLTDLEDAIEHQKKAVKLTPDGPDASVLLNELGNSLQSRFDRLGRPADIEDAISNQEMAVKLMPDGHPDMSRQLNNLGSALRFRFRHLGSPADINDAVSNQQKAVDLMPDDYPNKPTLLCHLGIALQSRFDRFGSLTDMKNAICNQRKAVELTPDGHPSKPAWLNNLGTAFQRQFQRSDNLADMKEAIYNMQKGVKLTPDGHPDKPSWLSNLGVALQLRFQRLGDLKDIHNAISNLRKSVSLTPDGHPDKPAWLGNLGDGFLAQFVHLGVFGDLERALSAFSTAAKSASGSAMERFRAARRWATVAEGLSRSPLDAFGCAIDLLPRIAWLGLTVTDQHALLADVGDIVCDAVTAAIKYEEYETAVVWAEQGRSIVWQNLLGLRSPVDDLCIAHPRLAEQLQNIARQLEGPRSHEALRTEGQVLPVEDASRRYSKLAVEWDNLVNEIREIPDFEGFLKAKGFNQLALAAHEGPVVILNANILRCDALALIPNASAEKRVSVVNIPLERFSNDRSKKLFQTLTGLLKLAGVRERNERKIIIGGSQLDREAKFKRILGILWQDVVKPVIESLAFQTQPERPPRIWWCATGLLAFLPIHAAGLYDTEEIGEKVSDYVVSSYTPTLTAILDLSEPVVREDFQVLMVAQASAPGTPPIPKTENEVRIVHRITASAWRMSLMRADATVERVREEMMKSHWIHLACHGQQHPDDPMESGFLLHDKTLKLSEIVKMSLPKADFAFLSACQTAMGDEKVAEESVHLAAGMFLSGCRGVIATTWSIRDDDAPKIAEDVYSRIFKDGKPNRKEAAYALHEAVKRLRESGAHCTSWVPFIHIGR